MKIKRFQVIRSAIALFVLVLNTVLPAVLYYLVSSKVAIMAQNAVDTNAIILIAFESWVVSRPKLDVNIKKIRKLIFIWLAIILIQIFITYIPRISGALFNRTLYETGAGGFFYSLGFFLSIVFSIVLGLWIGRKEKYNLDLITFSRINIKWVYAIFISCSCISFLLNLLWKFSVINDVERLLMDMFLVGIPGFLLLVTWIIFSIDKKTNDTYITATN